MKSSQQSENCALSRLVLMTLAVAAFSCIVTTAAGQGREEEGYSATEETLSPRESSWVVFTAYGQAKVTFEYKIESGKAVDIYIMTQVQFERGKAGAEPTQPGKDFIRHMRNVGGQGSTVETLQPGRYAIVFRNRSGQSVRVWTHATAIRL